MSTREFKLGALAMNLGIWDWNKIGFVYPFDNEQFRQTVFTARSMGLSVFGTPEMIRARQALGCSVEALGLVACDGCVDARQPIPEDPGRFRLVGWAFDRRTGEGPSDLFIADENGIVVGAACGGMERSDFSGIPGAKSSHIAFEGYARRTGQSAFRIYCSR
jgi:hypothetical protein